MDHLTDLREIRERVVVNPKQVGKGTTQKFWRIVGEIKRDPHPSTDEITLASEIRNILYHHRLGFPKSLRWLLLWFVFAALCLFVYLWAIVAIPVFTGNEMVDLWILLVVRYSAFGGTIFGFYPFGRLIAGAVLGIKLDGITRDIYYLPTLKINYETYLRVAPPRRMWFFFFAGIWTVITGGWVGALGWVIGYEWVGLLMTVILGLLEGAGIHYGGKWAGEMGHFKRERKVVEDWRRSQGQASSSAD